MELEKLGYEGIVLGYILIGILQSGRDVKLQMVVMIFYTAGKLLYYVIINQRFKKFVLIILILGIVGVSQKYGEFGVGITIIINTYELLQDNSWGMKEVGMIAAVIEVIRLNHYQYREALLFGVLTYSVFSYLRGTEKVIKSRKKIIDNQEDQIHKLDVQKKEMNTKIATIHEIAQMEERNKISQRIHDSIGHTLAGSLMQLQGLKFLVKDPKQIGVLDNVINELKSGMDDTRMILRKIKPDNNQKGLSELKSLCIAMEDKGLKVYLKNSIKWNINNEIWRIINANIREGFTNTLKYSSGDEVRIELQEHNRFLKIEMKDNGEGCGNIEKGMGISGIEERIREIGGKVILHGEGGFSIIQIIPKGEKI